MREILEHLLTSIEKRRTFVLSDKYGVTKIYFRPFTHILSCEKFHALQPVRFFISPLVRSYVHFLEETVALEVQCVISIGASYEHNEAKKCVIRHKPEKPLHIAVPVPLANDAFCTNRISHFNTVVASCSSPGHFPDIIIIDFDLLRKLPDAYHRVGIGEFIGLYTSIFDYFKVRGAEPPQFLIDMIIQQTRSLLAYEKNWLQHLSAALLFKCALMRLHGDHEIGASADHILSYGLDLYFRLSKRGMRKRYTHGQLVYLSTLILLALFPEWQQDIFSVDRLLEKGLFLRILDPQDLHSIFQPETLWKLLAKGLELRPHRKTILRTLDINTISNRLHILKKVLGKILLKQL